MKLVRYTTPQVRSKEWDALFGDPFRYFAPLFFAPVGSAAGAAPRRSAAGVEWFEDDANYYARIEVPGVKRDQLRLDAEEGVVRLGLERTEPGAGESVRSERSEFVLRCPEGVRTAGINARLADGILHLTLPKEEVRKPVNIEIQ